MLSFKISRKKTHKGSPSSIYVYVRMLEWKAIKLKFGLKKRNLFCLFLFMYRGSACLEKVAEVYAAGCFQMLLNSLNRGEGFSETSPSGMHKHTAWTSLTCTRHSKKTSSLLWNIRTVLDKHFPSILIIYDQACYCIL